MRRCLFAAALATTHFAGAAVPLDPAADLYRRGESSVIAGNQQGALEKFRAITKQYPKSPFAPQAQLQMAELLLRNREHVEAFAACQRVIENFPANGNFSRALEIQFTVAERVLQEFRLRRRKGDKSTRGLPDRETASGMLRIVLANGRFSPEAPRAQFRLAASLDEEGKPAEAVQEFNVFVQNYPKHALADDAAFQAGFIDYRSSRDQNHERGAQQRSRFAFEYFLIRYPESEKAPEARHLVTVLEGWESNRLTTAGSFYAKTAQPDSALKTLGEALSKASDPEQAESIKKKIESTFEKSPPPPRP